jgi:hypothetical protein
LAEYKVDLQALVIPGSFGSFDRLGINMNDVGNLNDMQNLVSLVQVYIDCALVQSLVVSRAGYRSRCDDAFLYALVTQLSTVACPQLSLTPLQPNSCLTSS